jgi:hypothetical protein
VSGDPRLAHVREPAGDARVGDHVPPAHVRRWAPSSSSAPRRPRSPEGIRRPLPCRRCSGHRPRLRACGS